MQVDTLAVYWGPRRESAYACADRLHQYFASLARRFPQLADWYEKGQTRTAALKGAVVNSYDKKALADLVAAGANKRDIGRQPIEELGFRMGFWNKRKTEEAMSLGITCGLSSSRSGATNAVVMELPKTLGAFSLDNDELLKELLLLHVAAWDADWGAVFSSASNAVTNREGTGPFFDKFLWVKRCETVPTKVQDLAKHEEQLGGTFYRN